MSLANLDFLLSEAFVAIKRNKLMAFASVTTMAIGLGLLGGALLVVLGVQRFAERQPARFEIAAFLQKGLSRQQAVNLQTRVSRMRQVKQVSLVPREQAWPEFRKALAGKVDTSGVAENPLPDALRIRVKDPRQTCTVAAAVRRMPGIAQVNDCHEQLKKVLALADFAKLAGTAIAIGLAFGTALIISNTIKLTLHARQREIGIMQLVGATRWFVRTPLVLEGIILGAMGGALGVGVVMGASAYLASIALQVAPLLAEFSSGVGIAQFAAGMTVAGACIGAMGSMISIRRYLGV